jgi:hypothetical protein
VLENLILVHELETLIIIIYVVETLILLSVSEILILLCVLETVIWVLLCFSRAQWMGEIEGLGELAEDTGKSKRNPVGKQLLLS